MTTKRGRPPTYCQEINGTMYVTPETLDKEVERLEKHRTDCRNRYRKKRDMLKKLRPDLFNTVNGCTKNRRALYTFGVPLSSVFPQIIEQERLPDQIKRCEGVCEIAIREAGDGPKTEV